jgi:DNA repair protein RecN (Recombination protein N)
LVEREHSKEFIQHQLIEINALNPKRGEDNELLAEMGLLAHAEKIMELASSAYYNLYECDDKIIARLALIRWQLEGLAHFVGDAGIALDSLLTGIASLTDVAESIRHYGSGLEYSPTRLDAVGSRLSDLEKVKRKYGTNLDGIIEMKNELLSNSHDWWGWRG